MTGVDLEVDSVSVRFGGLVAVDRVSLSAPGGAMTGLIGPNGAGKTTTFNACTGLVPVTEGRVSLGSARLDGHGTVTRARMGLGRTFQRMELFDSMSVMENVIMGPTALLSARRPWGQLTASRSEKRDIRARAESAMERCGITHLSAQVAGNLPTGQRRLVELARALASPFRFLLLDEPSSGLDVGETEHFGEVLRRFVADSGTGLLLVEHDMALVAAVCSHVYVLEFGRLIYSGPTADTLQSDVVRNSYLGTESDSMSNAPRKVANA